MAGYKNFVSNGLNWTNESMGSIKLSVSFLFLCLVEILPAMNSKSFKGSCRI